MTVIIHVLRWMLTIVIAVICGKLVSKVKLPSILGWLAAGMLLGPFACNLLPQELLDTNVYKGIIHVLECTVGLLIGTELVWRKIKSCGKALLITTLTQSLGTFIVVSISFCIVFVSCGIPLYLAFVFGGIALATAPAPALSIVQEFKTDGPVTRTLIPMAALDDIVGVIVFFTTITIVARHLSGGGLPIYMIPVMIVLPLLIGLLFGIPTGFVLRKIQLKSGIIITLVIGILLTSMVGNLCNTYLMPIPLLNFMLMGMAFSGAFSNLVSEEKLVEIMNDFQVIQAFAMIIVIINLGAPLDFHAILGAGLFTVVYIIMRAVGKYFGARAGAKLTNMPMTVQKYLGFTLLPHSGVSLVFTGIAASMLSTADTQSAALVTGTIAAAAIINEIIAVITAKKGFEWAKELNEK